MPFQSYKNIEMYFMIDDSQLRTKCNNTSFELQFYVLSVLNVITLGQVFLITLTE